MDNLSLAIPAIVTPWVVGALLWWRVGQVEREVLALRKDRHEMGNDVAKMQGAVETLKGVLVDTLRGGIRA